LVKHRPARRPRLRHSRQTRPLAPHTTPTIRCFRYGPSDCEDRFDRHLLPRHYTREDLPEPSVLPQGDTWHRGVAWTQQSRNHEQPP